MTERSHPGASGGWERLVESGIGRAPWEKAEAEDARMEDAAKEDVRPRHSDVPDTRGAHGRTGASANWCDRGGDVSGKGLCF